MDAHGGGHDEVAEGESAVAEGPGHPPAEPVDHAPLPAGGVGPSGCAGAPGCAPGVPPAVGAAGGTAGGPAGATAGGAGGGAAGGDP
ncbi:hypothetical protein ACFV9Z_35360, partial [Streptomyces sp. NPDC059883]